MLRTIISINEKDKNWLIQQAKLRHLTMAELVRRAIQNYRTKKEIEAMPNLEELLNATSGIWPQGDGLSYQHKLRDEWEDK